MALAAPSIASKTSFNCASIRSPAVPSLSGPSLSGLCPTMPTRNVSRGFGGFFLVTSQPRAISAGIVVEFRRLLKLIVAAPGPCGRTPQQLSFRCCSLYDGGEDAVPIIKTRRNHEPLARRVCYGCRACPYALERAGGELQLPPRRQARRGPDLPEPGALRAR